MGLETLYNPDTDIPDLSGKVMLITGGNSGLGKQCITHLARCNPTHIYFTSRSIEKAEQAVADIRSRVPNASVSYIQCDLSSLASVHNAAKEFAAKSSRLDVLVCNAGIMAVPPATSTDGYEIQFATNHMGHALLIKSLLPVMLKTTAEFSRARIVSVTSNGMALTPSHGIDFETLKTSQENVGKPGPWLRYGQSKLANALYSTQLAKRYPQITNVAIHPGVVRTDLFQSMPAIAKCLLWALETTRILRMLEPEEGAFNHTWAATASESEIENGMYYEPVGKRATGSNFLDDASLGERLWDWTQKELENFEL